MNRPLAAGLLCVGLVVGGAGPASAATFIESGDAGDTRATAAEANVSPLTSITGRVSSGTDRDLFRICLTGGQFTAGTTETQGDPILGLFREDGTLVAQDDDGGGGLESLVSGDFGTGVFFLAISAFPLFSINADTAINEGSGRPFNYTINLTGANQCLPTTAEQCKDGGFMNFGGRFKNQGDCVSFVKTNGKNEPGKNQPNGRSSHR